MANLFETDPLIVGYAHVALERGIDLAIDGLTYAIPASLVDLAVGDRVIVPLGKADRAVAGVVTTILDQEPSRQERIKPILARDPQELSLTTDLVELARWLAGYYCCPLGMVLATMIPAAVKRGTGTVQRTMISVAEATTNNHPQTSSDSFAKPTIPDDPPDDTPINLQKLTKLQKAILAAAQEQAQKGQIWIEIHHLAQMAGAKTVGPVKTLVDRGLLVTQFQQDVRAPTTTSTSTLPPAPEIVTQLSSDSSNSIDNGIPTDAAVPKTIPKLTPLQQQAVDHLIAQAPNGFGVHLLHGVTGSGKTEVYMRFIEHVLGTHTNEQTDKTDDAMSTTALGAIVLVPEIALTPQTVARFTKRFGSVAVLHSGLTAAARHEQWRRIHRGQARVVVGARSAVFAPLPHVGVIIVDEEHDSSYKQDQLPRYHGRDVAIKRAQILDIPIVLGSATPSLESFFNATVKKSYHLIKLTDRVPGVALPRVEVVDMAIERKQRKGINLISQRLEQALRKTFTDQGQALLLLNRRGWAHYIACPDPACGWLMNCHYCDAMMVYHRDRQLPTGGLLRCHHCRAEQLLPRQCPLCSKKVVIFGEGTQRLEYEVEKKLPNIRMLRMDSDSMRTGRDYQETLEKFGRGDVDLLVGTQIIAKGLDFPNVRLVGVISADLSLHMPDFRASERTFQLIAQVAGRAGRGEHAGLVIVQSYQPDDPAVAMACQHDFDSFAQRELTIRQQAALPPYARMARIVVRDQQPAKVEKHATRLTEHLCQVSEKLNHRVQVQGPAPCPIARIAGYHRRQIELIAPGPTAARDIQDLLATLRQAKLLVSDAHTAVDVDPVALV